MKNLFYLFLWITCLTGNLVAQSLPMDIGEGYKFYNEQKQILSFKDIINPITLDPHQNKFARPWLNYDSIAKHYKPYWTKTARGSFAETDIDTVFTEKQIVELNRKWKGLTSVKLDSTKIPDFIILSSRSSKKSSFPIIQVGKDSVLYTFQYQEFAHAGNWARIYVSEKRSGGNWKSIGQVNIPLFDFAQFQQKMKEIPEEYQVINIFLAGRKETVLEEFIEINAPVNKEEQFNYLLEYETWDLFQRDALFQQEYKDYRKLFTEEDLQKMVNYLNNSSSGNLKSRYLLGDITSISKKRNQKEQTGYGLMRLSRPFIFISDKQEKYSLFYWEKVNGPENGSGNLVLFQLNDEGVWEMIFTTMLWIS